MKETFTLRRGHQFTRQDLEIITTYPRYKKSYDVIISLISDYYFTNKKFFMDIIHRKEYFNTFYNFCMFLRKEVFCNYNLIVRNNRLYLIEIFANKKLDLINSIKIKCEDEDIYNYYTFHSFEELKYNLSFETDDLEKLKEFFKTSIVDENDVIIIY